MSKRKDLENDDKKTESSLSHRETKKIKKDKPAKELKKKSSKDDEKKRSKDKKKSKERKKDHHQSSSCSDKKLADLEKKSRKEFNLSDVESEEILDIVVEDKASQEDVEIKESLLSMINEFKSSDEHRPKPDKSLDAERKSKKSSSSKSRKQEEVIVADDKNETVVVGDSGDSLKVTEFRKINKISIDLRGSACQDQELKPILSFESLNWDAKLKQCVANFERPTPIQSECWPYVLAGHDVIGIAETGSGKTLAFGIPAFHHLLGKKQRGANILVMAPTRELAIQIEDSLSKCGSSLDIKACAIYGGVSKRDNIQILKSNKVNIIVATPGRLIDLIDGGHFSCKDISFLVLDEADRMLDMGFEKDIRRIMKECSHSNRQTVMFSATWPTSVRSLASEFLKKPVKITIGSDELVANQNVKQFVQVLQDNRAKDGILLDLLRKYHSSKSNRVLVFALYKKEAMRVEAFLKRNGYSYVESIHGDKSQSDRISALEKFRSGQCPLLVATDVAARGLDIPNVEVVLNYTYPLTSEDYVHRIGRTGRAGKKGISHTLFTPFDKAHAGTLIQVLKTANQPVPDELMKFGTTIKKKEHKDYGAFYKDIDPNEKSSHVKFDSD